ncbi:hypothetical protein SAMN05216566_1211, partial [Aureimonas phyllosphaerae]
AVLDQHRRPRLSFFRSLFNSQRTRQTTKVRRSGDQPGQPPFKHARSKLEKTRPTLTRGAKPSQPAIPSQISRKNTTANPTSRQTNQTASAVQPVRPGATAVVDERLIGGDTQEGQQGNAGNREENADRQQLQQLATAQNRQTSVTTTICKRYREARVQALEAIGCSIDLSGSDTLNGGATRMSKARLLVSGSRGLGRLSVCVFGRRRSVRPQLPQELNWPIG